MSDLTSRFEALKKKKEDLSKKKIQCEVRRDSLNSEIQNDLATLRDKYGVSDLNEAKKLLNSKELELDAKTKALEEELKKYENSIDIDI